jgi:hypothetical protein
MAFIFLVPYLRVGNEPLDVGPWKAVPASELSRAHTSSDVVTDQARGLLALYQRSRRVPDGYGVFLRRGRRLIGEDFTTKDLLTLRRVLFVALIDGNPSDVGGSDTMNAGHQTWTSDNVDIIGHGVDPNGYVTTRYGSMVQTLKRSSSPSAFPVGR